MATYSYDTLQQKYGKFSDPEIVIKVNDNELTGKNPNSKKAFPVGDVVVDLTCGYEASIAEFSIYDVYDLAQNEFLFENIKKYILLGSKIEIEMGYRKTTTTVFLGVITRVNFVYEVVGIPCIRVTAMDVKGVMMAGSYEKQLKSTTYSDAVAEILRKTAYDKLKNSGIITKLTVQSTPDKIKAKSTAATQGTTGAVSAASMEMVAESDYDFVVKAAKRNNYEFYTECGDVKFRKAKSDTKIMMEIAPTMSLRSFDISYDISGIVDKVIVRGMDVSKAKLIKTEKKLSNKLSQGNKVKSVITGSQKVYVDSTVSSTEDAEARADALAEKIAYRYGTMNCEIIGIPEMQPGHFIRLYGLGTEPNNIFYLTRVRHEFDTEGRYLVKLEGVSDSVEESSMDSLGDLSSVGSLSGLGDLGDVSDLTDLDGMTDLDDLTDLGGLTDGLDVDGLTSFF